MLYLAAAMKPHGVIESWHNKGNRNRQYIMAAQLAYQYRKAINENSIVK
jgi:ribosomal protein S8